jgi:hypothetical protein
MHGHNTLRYRQKFFPNLLAETAPRAHIFVIKYRFGSIAFRCRSKFLASDILATLSENLILQPIDGARTHARKGTTLCKPAP